MDFVFPELPLLLLLTLRCDVAAGAVQLFHQLFNRSFELTIAAG